MKKIIVFVFLVMAVMIVAGCQSGETLAGQATKSQVAECKANKDCNALFGACGSKNLCTKNYPICTKSCSGTAAEIKACKSVCLGTYTVCLNSCYDEAIAQWKGGAVATTSGPAKDSNGLVFGDINLDGKLNTADVQCYALVGQNPATTCMPASATKAPVDLNCDAKIDAIDQSMVAKLLVGDVSAVDGNKNGVLDCKEPQICLDSDGTYSPSLKANQSVNTFSFLVKSSTTGLYANKQTTWNDRCNPNGKVNETFCLDKTKIDTMEYDCPSETSCKDGACVKDVPTCTAGPTGKIFCKNVIDSAGNQFYAIKELQNAKCEKWYPQYFEKEYSTVCGLTADSCVEGKGCVAVAPIQPKVCPTPDIICTAEYKLGGVVEGWYAYTRKMDSSCNTIDWTPFTAGNTSCGMTEDSCVSGKGCVVAPNPSSFSCGSDKNTLNDGTKCAGWISYSVEWDCKTDNTTFAGCGMSKSEAFSKCNAAGTCKN